MPRPATGRQRALRGHVPAGAPGQPLWPAATPASAKLVQFG